MGACEHYFKGSVIADTLGQSERERSPRTGTCCQTAKPRFPSERDFSVSEEIQQALGEEIGKAKETLTNERAENDDKKGLHETSWEAYT